MSVLAIGPRAYIALGGGGFIVLGLAAAAIAAMIAVSRGRFRRRAVQVTGTIVGHETTAMRESGVMYYSVVEFAPPGGEMIRARTRTASNPAAGRVGSTATVFYDPGDPYRIAIDTGRTAAISGCAIAVVTLLTITFVLFGVVLLQIGLSS